MYLKSDIPETPQKEPFINDLLNRLQYADVLTNIVRAIEGGGTISVNAEWGYGKTTFVRMWKAQLKQKGYNTIYLNAWENDYAPDPFMVIIDEVVEQLKCSDFSVEKKQLLQAAVETLIGIAKAIPAISLAGQIGEAIKKGIDKSSEDKNRLQEFRTYKDLIKEFKSKLATAIKTITEDKPLIFFIDELDRCRPNYAIEFLERIKHLFSIDNIIFVLSVDKSVLLESIKCFYGSSNIQAENYLRRFIDIDFALPIPAVDNFVTYQFKYHGLDKYLQKQRYKSQNFNNAQYDITISNALTHCFKANMKSLRDIEKYFNRLDLVLHALNVNNVYAEIIVFLTYIYMFAEGVFNKIYNLEYTYVELLDSIEQVICRKNIDVNSYETRLSFSVLIGILCLYENEIKDAERNLLILPGTKGSFDNYKFKILPSDNFNQEYQVTKNKLRDKILIKCCQCIKISDNFHYNYDDE